MEALTEVKRSSVRQAVAAIIFDSLAQRFAGARGSTDARQVVSRAGELDIHLKISSTPSQQRIMGQVFARNETQFHSSVRVQLLQDGVPLKTTWSDNFGQFQFDEVPHGVLVLQIDLPQLTVISGITIGEQL